MKHGTTSNHNFTLRGNKLTEPFLIFCVQGLSRTCRVGCVFQFQRSFYVYEYATGVQFGLWLAPHFAAFSLNDTDQFRRAEVAGDWGFGGCDGQPDF
jgi:hypothetical protein